MGLAAKMNSSNDGHRDSLVKLSSPSSAICSVSLSSNLMSLNQDGSEWPSTELTESLSGEGVSENSVLYKINEGRNART